MDTNGTLGKSNESIRTILERGPAVVYHCSQYWDYGIDYVTSNIEELTGWSVADFTDNPVFRLEVVHPDDLHDVLRDVPNLFDKGRQKYEYRLRKKDGEYIWVMDDVRALFTEDGQYDGLVGYLTDITELKSAERRLRESELRHRAIFETVLEGIITIDSKGIVHDMNRAAENIFGYSAHMVIGKNVSMLMPEPFASNHDDYLERYLQTSEARIIGVGRTVTGRRINGETFEMNLSVSELKLPGGRFFVGAVRDVSQRIKAEKKLRTSQERLRMSQQFAKMGTWDWHISDDRLFWSEQMFDLYGLPNDGCEERKERVGDWALAEDMEHVQETIRKSIRGGGGDFKMEYRILHPDGSIHWVREQGSVVRNSEGHAVRMLGITQDISAEKAHEEELEQARIAADNANLAKSEFLSRMSHELRTPLNAILGFAQLLGMSSKHPLVDRQQKQVDQIVAAGTHLMDLINEVLDLSRIEAGHLNLQIEAVDFQTVFEESIELNQNAALQKDVTLHLGDMVQLVLKADRTRFKQVVLNLMSNAIKYNRIGGDVFVNAMADGTDRIRFEITDTGNGIPAKKQSHMFSPFDRLGAENTEIEGTGIGLTLTKQLVEAMGGSIGFRSKEGEGTTFWVSLPCVTGKSLVDPEPKTNKNKKKIVFIDRNSDNVDVLKQFADMKGGLSFVFTQQFAEGLELIEAHEPDLVICSCLVRKEAGNKPLAAIRALKTGEEVPVMVYLGEGGECTPDMLEEGYVDYLHAPLNLKELKEKLAELWNEVNEPDK